MEFFAWTTHKIAIIVIPAMIRNAPKLDNQLT
jgi:hypothetical protein